MDFLPAARLHQAGRGLPVLAAVSLREMHKPRYLAGDHWTSAWGISWYASRHDDVSWVQHSGGLPGFTASVCFDPGQQAGAIVLHNGTRGSGARAGTVEYRPLLGLYARADLGGGVLSLQWRAGSWPSSSPRFPPGS